MEHATTPCMRVDWARACESMHVAPDLLHSFRHASWRQLGAGRLLAQITGAGALAAHTWMPAAAASKASASAWAAVRQKACCCGSANAALRTEAGTIRTSSSSACSSSRFGPCAACAPSSAMQPHDPCTTWRRCLQHDAPGAMPGAPPAPRASAAHATCRRREQPWMGRSPP